MLKSVEGIYRDGKIELLEKPEDVDEAKVIVTFISKKGLVDLRKRGIGKAQAGELRARLKAFTEDWERPEMDAYDDLYSRNKPHHPHHPQI